MNRFFFWFLTESYGEAAWLGKLRRTYGFCRSHSQRLVETGPRYQLSYITQTLVRAVAAEFEKITAGASAPTPERCPACHAEDESAVRVIRHLLLTFHEEKIATRYQAGSGLCWQHLLQALRVAPPEYHARLLAPVRRRLAAFEAEFAEYFRKVDYRYSHEPKGNEQHAWFRALRFLVGEALRPTAPDLAQPTETHEPRRDEPAAG
jgi:hypothetical protein